jgi:hypothetical protein
MATSRNWKGRGITLLSRGADEAASLPSSSTTVSSEISIVDGSPEVLAEMKYLAEKEEKEEQREEKGWEEIIGSEDGDEDRRNDDDDDDENDKDGRIVEKKKRSLIDRVRGKIHRMIASQRCRVVVCSIM